MKYVKKLIFCTVIGAAFLTSCNKTELTDLNINPQALSTIDLNFMFTSAQLGAASGGSAGDNWYTDWRTNINVAGYAIQHLASLGGELGEKYVESGTTFESNNAPFEFAYADQLKNLGAVLKESGPGGFAEGRNQNLRQATRILRAFLFHRITDYYGSIPYFETMQADNGVFYPHYDKQKDIYTDLLKELDEATAAFGAADPTDGFAQADLYYGGDIAKWKKLGYSLMLRLAMRVSYVDAAMANTYVAKAVAGGVFTSNTDNVMVPMDDGPAFNVNQNGITRSFVDGGQTTILSKTLIDFLKGPNTGSTADDDPRLMIITEGIAVGTAAAKTNPLDQKGMPNGYNQTLIDVLEGHPVDAEKTYSRLNSKFLDRNEPYMLMNYGEVELLLAEASQRSIGGLTPAQAEAHYNAGVKASMQMYNQPHLVTGVIYGDASFVVTDAQVAAYLAAFPYNAATALEMIGEQYWVNHFLNWYEAWTNWRRTTADPAAPNGHPALIPVNYPGNVTGGKIIQKLTYPDEEVSNNPNFAAGASANDNKTKVWWAGGPE